MVVHETVKSRPSVLQTVLVLPTPRGDETNVCVSVAFEALFVIAQVWKYMSIDDKSIKKLWDVCVCALYTPMSII